MADIPEDIADNQQENSKKVIGKPFPPGVSGNPKGRPKGKTMKEYAREFLMSMTDDKKLEFLNTLSKEVVWKMAEGNPHQDTDIKHDVSDNLFELINNAIGKGESDTIPGEDKE